MRNIYSKGTSKNNLELNKIIRIACLFSSFTFCIFAPVELYLLNVNEFWFSLTDIILGLIFVNIIVFLSGAFVGKCCSERFKKYWICIIFGLGIGLYIQGNFLDFDTGVFNGDVIDWNQYKVKIIISVMIWIFIFVGESFLMKFKNVVFYKGVKYVSLFLLGVQLLTLIILLITNPIAKDYNFYFSSDKMFELAKEENVITFVLDTYDASFFEEYIKNDKYLKEELKDFTYFPYAVAGSAPTANAIPLLLTGEYYEYTEFYPQRYEKYKSNAYEKSKLFKVLEENKFDTRILSDSMLFSYNLSEYIDNMILEKPKVKSYKDLLGGLYQFAAYKYFPSIMKEKLWFSTEKFNQYMKQDGTTNPFQYFNDANFYSNLIEQPLQLGKNNKSFRFYHLKGVHGPYTMDSECRTVDNTTRQEQEKGIWKIMIEYLEQLKALNLYDDATIIICADHGGKEIFQNPLFLIKNRFDNNQKLTYNKAQISFEEYVPTIIESIGGYLDDNRNSVFDISINEDRERKHYCTANLAEKYTGKVYKSDASWVKFEITGNPREESSIREVEFKPDRSYKLGSEEYFFAGGDANDYFLTGLSAQEQNYTWADGMKSEFNICLENNPKRDLIAKFNIASIFMNQQEVKIYCGNALLFSDIVTTENSEINFKIPKECIIDNNLNLIFEYPDAKSTYDLGMVEEKSLERVLSLGYEAFIIE